MELYVEKGTQKLKNEFGRDLRFPKQFGDFAETLVMYILGLKSWSVALIDHVGADIIAINKDSLLRRFAISVKGEIFQVTKVNHLILIKIISINCVVQPRCWEWKRVLRLFLLMNRKKLRRLGYCLPDFLICK